MITAIVAETLIEMGVLIFTEPAEIHWPNGLISKLSGPTGSKKGKKAQKTKHGVFGELVSNLAPSIPPSSGDATKKVGKKPTAKGFKNPVKNKPSATVSTNLEEISEAGEGVVGGSGDSGVDAIHQGLPAQGRRGV